MNPPMPTLAPVSTRIRVDRLIACAAGLGVGVSVPVGVGEGVGVAPVAVAVAVATAVAVAVAMAVSRCCWCSCRSRGSSRCCCWCCCGCRSSSSSSSSRALAVAVAVAVAVGVGVPCWRQEFGYRRGGRGTSEEGEPIDFLDRSQNAVMIIGRGDICRSQPWGGGSGIDMSTTICTCRSFIETNDK